MLTTILIETAAIFVWNNGVFSYTLDDPYIHLALAENLRHGHNGINANEFSAPSSSIIWPFLLVPFAAHSAVPLIINIFCALGTCLVCFRMIDHAVPIAEPRKKTFVTTALTFLLMLFTNSIGVVFTGMEHSLQLLVTSLIAMGLIEHSRSRRCPAWLWGCLIVAPLIRYEMMGVCLTALLYLTINGRRRQSALALLMIGGLLALFAAFLHQHGLGTMPSSVMMKSEVVRTSGKLQSAMANFIKNLESNRGMVLVLGLVGLCAFALFERNNSRRQLAACSSLALLAHLIGGRFGNYNQNRYELYIVLFMSLILIHLSQDLIFSGLEHPGAASRSALKGLGLACILTLLAASPYVWGLFYIPLASNNIYQQHYQMHRFAVDYYGSSVAVNDIGWVGYHNPHYVLDLYGLGSREAMRARLGGAPDWMEELVRKRDVKFAMIYERIFRDAPKGWVKIAELRLRGKRITPLDSAVTFYALDATEIPRIKEALKSFVPTLPAGARFILTDKPLPPRDDCDW